MQIGPPPSGAQALAGALDSAAVRQQLGATRTDSARAISAVAKSEKDQDSSLRTKRDPEDDDRTHPLPKGSRPNSPRGSLVDIRA